MTYSNNDYKVGFNIVFKCIKTNLNQTNIKLTEK